MTYLNLFPNASDIEWKSLDRLETCKLCRVIHTHLVVDLHHGEAKQEIPLGRLLDGFEHIFDGPLDYPWVIRCTLWQHIDWIKDKIYKTSIELPCPQSKEAIGHSLPATH